MARDCKISLHITERQQTIMRIACDPVRSGLTLKEISEASGIPYSTLRSYAGNNGEPAEMPLSALYKLVGVIPDELLSLLLPAGRMIVEVPAEIDHDEVCALAQDLLIEKARAHHPESPAGRDIAPEEDVILRTKTTRLRVAG
jgi:transcriptional regulator with XRE-family HTH domain